jgi:hypothetical protein
MDTYWDNLFKAGESAPGIEAAAMAGASTKRTFGSKLLKGAKTVGPGLIGWMLLDKILASRNKTKDQALAMEAMQAEAGLQTPENLYYQAALPQAQAEEEQARQMLLSSISGGVLGPSLPRGYRVIGGR